MTAAWVWLFRLAWRQVAKRTDGPVLTFHNGLTNVYVNKVNRLAVSRG